MNSYLSEVITPIATLIVGALLKWYLDTLTDYSKRSHDRKNREEEREFEKEKTQTNFQRETLIKLQDAMNDLGRASAQCFANEVETYKQSGVYGIGSIKNELADTEVSARMEFTRQLSRVIDEEVCAACRIFANESLMISNSTSYGKANEHFIKMISLAESLNVKIGDRIKTIYIKK